MSVGHVARLLEAAGIPTVVVGVRAFKDRMTALALPRLLVTPHLMGRPIGPPHNRPRQLAVLRAALELLEKATGGGAVIEMPGRHEAPPPSA